MGLLLDGNVEVDWNHAAKECPPPAWNHPANPWMDYLPDSVAKSLQPSQLPEDQQETGFYTDRGLDGNGFAAVSLDREKLRTLSTPAMADVVHQASTCRSETREKVREESTLFQKHFLSQLEKRDGSVGNYVKKNANKISKEDNMMENGFGGEPGNWAANLCPSESRILRCSDGEHCEEDEHCWWTTLRRGEHCEEDEQGGKRICEVDEKLVRSALEKTGASAANGNAGYDGFWGGVMDMQKRLTGIHPSSDGTGSALRDGTDEEQVEEQVGGSGGAAPSLLNTWFPAQFPM